VTPAPSVSSTLRELADLADIRGASLEAAELRRAAAVIDASDKRGRDQITQLARRDRLGEIPGLSPALHWRLRELTLGDAAAALRSARAAIPSLLRRLLEFPVVDSAEALVLVRDIGVITSADLAHAIDDGRVAHALGGGVESRLREALATVRAEARPMTLGRTWDLLERFLAAVAQACPAFDDIAPAGDARRFEPLVGAIVLAARAADPASALGALCSMTGIDDVVHRGARRAMIIFQQVEIDVRVSVPEEYGSTLFEATGSREHVAAVVRRRSRTEAWPREQDVYAHAGLPWIPPELRHDSGEIEAASAGTLPVLVARDHMRGDLHMHSTYSDGGDTVGQMVAACAALGYEYMAITDHSRRAAASRTVSVDDLARQRDEIARLREQHPHIVILHGIEADILPDGRLDFDDEVLAGLDIVLASLHDPARHDAKRLTRRCLQAIRHPLVSVITHPANRLVGRRAGYELDFDAIYAVAVETGTALEIDGAPSHLDLDGEHARAAVAAGVTVTIDSDCHRARLLDRQMRLGIGTARRGWVEPRHVLNTRPYGEVRAFIARKRGTAPS
jgi:DNA polymerase (family 10)